MLREGADPDLADAHGWTAVHWAATDVRSDGGFLRLLINEGADIEVQDSLSGWTPLHVAAVKSNWEAASALIDAGAKKMARSSLGETPLRCVKRVRSNTKLFDALTTHPKQLNGWPAKWLDSELRGRQGGRRDDDVYDESDDNDNDDESDDDSSFRNTRDTKDEKSRNSRDESDRDGRRDSRDDRSNRSEEDEDYDDDDYED